MDLYFQYRSLILSVYLFVRSVSMRFPITHGVYSAAEYALQFIDSPGAAGTSTIARRGDPQKGKQKKISKNYCLICALGCY